MGDKNKVPGTFLNRDDYFSHFFWQSVVFGDKWDNYDDKGGDSRIAYLDVLDL